MAMSRIMNFLPFFLAGYYEKTVIFPSIWETEKSERGKNCNSVSCSWNYYGIYSGQQTEHKKVILGNGKL